MDWQRDLVERCGRDAAICAEDVHAVACLKECVADPRTKLATHLSGEVALMTCARLPAEVAPFVLEILGQDAASILLDASRRALELAQNAEQKGVTYDWVARMLVDALGSVSESFQLKPLDFDATRSWATRKEDWTAFVHEVCTCFAEIDPCVRVMQARFVSFLSHLTMGVNAAEVEERTRRDTIVRTQVIERQTFKPAQVNWYRGRVVDEFGYLYDDQDDEDDEIDVVEPSLGGNFNRRLPSKLRKSEGRNSDSGSDKSASSETEATRFQDNQQYGSRISPPETSPLRQGTEKNSRGLGRGRGRGRGFGRGGTPSSASRGARDASHTRGGGSGTGRGGGQPQRAQQPKRGSKNSSLAKG
ncbi:hypothetical protein FVE85_3170 [Porphyridium purpureum]|uniref:Uncharacterized protein n=1 Tax=Porphyridium purpureum TaxID=35688 RepID=A0A5J4YTU5_PORPP|nr:hypothetical protein FVE85_3170 [Porphyridium purpureum]|eukprot:POR2058..scf227_4